MNNNPYKTISLTQNTPEWLEYRKGHVGASDVPIIMGLSPWRTRYQLLLEKKGKLPGQKENASMRRGHEMEEAARHKAQEVLGVSLFP